MKLTLVTQILFIITSTAFAQTQVLKKEDLLKLGGDKEYMKHCRSMIKESKPTWDALDINMICANPYLYPVEGESTADKARREKLLKETDADKRKVLQGGSSGRN